MFKLRELERKDICIINSWRNDPELIELLGAPFRYINSEVDSKWFDSYISNRNTTIRCAVTEDDNDKIIGLVSLTDIDHLNQSATLHIMIGDKAARGKGAGTFAVKKMIDHAFRNINLHRIELSVLNYNLAAIHVYEKCGFIREGVKRQAVYKNGTFTDMYLYAVLREIDLEG